MALISRLGVVLGLDTSEFVKGLGIADTKLKDFGSKVKTGLATAVALAGAEMIAATKQAADYADEMFKASQKVGVTTEQLSALRYAADLADVEFGQLQGGLIKLSKAMNEAYSGSDNMKQAFKDAGIAITDNNGKLRDTNTVFIELADRFQKANDGATKTAMAMKFFGKSGAEMIPMLNGGAKAIKEATAEAEKFGLIVTTEAGKAAEAFNDNMERMRKATQGLQIEFGNKLIPAFASAAEWMVKTAKEGKYLESILLGIGLAFAKLFKGADFGTEMGALNEQIKTYEITLENLYKRLRQLQGMDSWTDKVFPKAKKAEIAGIENEIGNVNARLIELQHRRAQLQKQQDAEKAAQPEPVKDDFKVTNDEAQKLLDKVNQQILAYEKQKQALKGVTTEVQQLQLEFGKGGKFEGLDAKSKETLLNKAKELDATQAMASYDQKRQEYMLQMYELGKDIQRQHTERADAQRESVDLQVKELESQTRRADYERQLVNLSDTQREKALAYFDLKERIIKLGADPMWKPEQIDAIQKANQELIKVEEANKRAQNTFQAGWNNAYANFKERASDSAAMGAQAFQTMSSNMETAISNFVRTGKLSFKELIASMISDLTMLYFKAQATNFFSMFGGGFGGGGGGGLGSWIGETFGMTGASGWLSGLFFADGGNPPVGKASVVGENGPELFVPRTAGTIIPNNQIGNALNSQPQIIYNGPYIANMSAIDTQSAAQFLAKNKDSVWAANQSAQRALPMSRG